MNTEIQKIIIIIIMNFLKKKKKFCMGIKLYIFKKKTMSPLMQEEKMKQRIKQLMKQMLKQNKIVNKKVMNSLRNYQKKSLNLQKKKYMKVINK